MFPTCNSLPCVRPPLDPAFAVHMDIDWLLNLGGVALIDCYRHLSAFYLSMLLTGANSLIFSVDYLLPTRDLDSTLRVLCMPGDVDWLPVPLA